MKNCLLPVLFMILTACSKGQGEDKDSENPVVTLNTPTNTQVFTAGQNIMISGLVTDNKYIMQIHIVIANLATAEEYLHYHIHPATRSFNFNQSFTPQAGITYKISVIGEDPSANLSIEKFVQVSCN